MLPKIKISPSFTFSLSAFRRFLYTDESNMIDMIFSLVLCFNYVANIAKIVGIILCFCRYNGSVEEKMAIFQAEFSGGIVCCMW